MLRVASVASWACEVLLCLTCCGFSGALREDSLLMPLVAHERVEQFDSIEDRDRRAFVAALFVPSFYEPACDIGARLIIKPVYFWPGQRVDLRCVMCRKAFVYNGNPKYWMFLASKDVNDAFKQKDLRASPKWQLLFFMARKSFGAAPWKFSGTMPYTDPRQSRQSGSRPGTTFLQRNGVLTIFQPTAEVEGIYRCLDSASLANLNFVYYLIAMQPLFVYWSARAVQMDQLNKECPSGSRGFPDMNWKFRHVPPAFIRSHAPVCPRKPCTSWALQHPPVNDKVEWQVKNEQLEELTRKYVNLKVVLEWSEWTPCSAGQRVRTREGHCYLRKIDPRKRIRGLTEMKIGDPYGWVDELSNLFEEIEEFANLGLRLFSGIVAKSIFTYVEKKDFDSCYSRDSMNTIYGWDETVLFSFGFHNQLKGFLDASNRLCFEYYSNAGAEDPSPERALLGSPLTETEQCPPSVIRERDRHSPV